jgi:hypothetical protein
MEQQAGKKSGAPGMTPSTITDGMLAFLDLFELSQVQGTFESLEVNGTDMTEVQAVVALLNKRIIADDRKEETQS